MDKQIKRCISILLFIIVMPAGLALSAPADPAQATRYTVMNNELNCIQNNMQQKITWSDVCDISDTNSQPAAAPKDAVLEHWNNYPNNNDAPATEPDLYKEYQYQISPEFSYISYSEPSVHMRERGPMFGIYGAYDWRPEAVQSWPINVLHLDGDFEYGLIDYKSPDAEVNDLNDYKVEPRLWLGRDFTPFGFTRFTPYIGLGYRYLFDHLGQVADIGGYDRSSEYLYAPIGFELLNGSIDGWQLGLNVEYDIFIQGWQESYLSDLSNTYPDLNNKQNSGYGVRGSFDIIKKMEHINLIFSPYIRYWNIKQSKMTTAVNSSSEISFTAYEPANKFNRDRRQDRRAILRGCGQKVSNFIQKGLYEHYKGKRYEVL